MRVFKNEVEYQGTPYEIHELWSLQEPKKQYADTATGSQNFVEDDFTPLVDAVEESKTLREKLSSNPMYNPFGGVVASKFTEDDIDTHTKNVTAEEDTGVKLI